MQLEIADLDPHRPALIGHCYRMLGSIADAEDAVQETFIRAWKNLSRFEGRSSVKTWLYRIATNVSLDFLSSSARKSRPMEEGPAGRADSTLETRDRTHWLEPIPDALAIAPDMDPHERAVQRESLRLAFVSALQHLPPRQRAALLLTEVVGWSAAEAADCLEMSVASVNSALQRARATLGTRSNASARELTDEESSLVDSYMDAFLRYDVDALVGLLRDNVVFSMPPYTLWLQGPSAIREWLVGPGAGCRGSRLVRVQASASPAFAHYHPGKTPGTFDAWAMIVLELDNGTIAGWNSFLDTATLFPKFGLPMQIEEPDL
jgi:RNA polymerase sigma-70 factor (ECF subfamily)